MTVSTKIDIVGLKEDLRVIQDLDKKLRREITKEFAAIVKDPVEEAKRNVPSDAPLSGFNRRWATRSGFVMFPWNGTLGPKGIKPFVSGKKPKEFNGIVKNLAVFGLRWTNSRAAVLDMSRKGETQQGRTMINALDRRFGKASRIMWPAYEKHRVGVENEVRSLVAGVAHTADKLTRKR
jgi:hypothetical protein